MNKPNIKVTSHTFTNRKYEADLSDETNYDEVDSFQYHLQQPSNNVNRSARQTHSSSHTLIEAPSVNRIQSQLSTTSKSSRGSNTQKKHTKQQRNKVSHSRSIILI
jgi:hypothetical protein